MPKINADILALNRGRVSVEALARTDIQRVRLSAEIQHNFIPKTLGPMRIKPGTGYIGSSKSNLAGNFIDFIAATDDAALLELTNGVMRVWIDDALLTRPSVTTSISNGSFSSSTNWTNGSTGGGAVSYGGTGLVLNATNRGGLSKVTRQITVSGGNQNIEHALAINVTRGPVTFRCGSASGGDEYITETELATGRHSLAFTPTGNFHLTFQSDLDINRIVASIAVEASGAVELVTPWATADLDNLAWHQSADVVFVAGDGKQQYRIERRGTGRSWSIVKYAPDNGPFSTGRTAKVRLKPAATRGNTTLASDLPFFKSTHVGAIFRLFHSGYVGSFRLGAEDTYSDPIRVSGVDNGTYSDRDWSYTISGTWAGILRVQRSFDGPDSGFHEFRRERGSSTIDITANATFANEDDDDNSLIYYRVGFEPGAYTSGAAIVTYDYRGGGDHGLCRVTGFTSSTQVDIEVLRPFTGTVFTADWREGLWSDRRGWPTETAVYEGRLWWFGRDKIIGSVSDDYANFDPDYEGDAGPIIRSIGTGPVDKINFALPLARLVIGTAGQEISIRSSSFDEVISPSNMNAKDCSTQGSAAVRAAKIDKRGVYVQRSGRRVYELVYSAEANDYQSSELTLLNPDIAPGGISSVAVQRQPDTRMHFVLADGSVAILTYEPSEELSCWTTWSTDGFVERVAVLPGVDEDAVYYHIRRTIDGNTVRYLEKWAQESECQGDTLCKLADSFIVYSGAATDTITGLGHLEGKEVIVWADGRDLSPDDDEGVQTTYTVDGGSITLDEQVTSAVIGLPYEGEYRSTKLAYGAAGGTALTQPKRVHYLALILANTHNNALRVGGDFDHLDPLPRIHEGKTVTADQIFEGYDAPAFPINGNWNTDSRVCLKARAPRPCTALAMVVGLETNDKL
jgi:hypothetical protein